MSTQLPDIFYEAAAGEDTRYCISRPYRTNGFICATDGRMLVRMPDHPDYDVPETVGHVPDPVDLFKTNKFRDTPSPFPFPLPPPKWDTIGDEDHDPIQLRREAYAAVHVEFGWYVQAGFLRILRNAGVTTIQVPSEAYDGSIGFANRPCYFRGDGFDGLVMCCKATENGE